MSSSLTQAWNCLQSSSSAFAIHSLLPELSQIVVHMLPIDMKLRNLALSCKSHFTYWIIKDDLSAKAHLKLALIATTRNTLTPSSVDACGIFDAFFAKFESRAIIARLPMSYRRQFYIYTLSTFIRLKPSYDRDGFKLLKLLGISKTTDDLLCLKVAKTLEAANRWIAYNMACIEGHTNTAAYLLTTEMDPHQLFGGGLKQAAKYGHCDIIALLLNDQRIKQLKFPHLDPLFDACSNGHGEAVKLLLEKQTPDYIVWKRALTIAVAQENSPIVSILLADEWFVRYVCGDSSASSFGFDLEKQKISWLSREFPAHNIIH